jgi:ADP-ribose pyrophosphatase
LSDAARPPSTRPVATRPSSTPPLTTRPRVRIEVVGDRTAQSRSNEGFLRVRRVDLVNHYEDGTQSRPYAYDCAERTAMDAVAIVLHTTDRRVCLRSSIRPPLAFRAGYALPLEGTEDPTLFEIPAGLVEKDERGEEGLRACCARETEEEVGLAVLASSFTRLGPAVYLTPGLIAEKIHLLHALVDPRDAKAPSLDGSPVEENARIEWVPLDEALAACRDGRIEDIKTELGLRRLADELR